MRTVAIALAAVLATLAGTTRASETYESYDAFYATRPGAVFSHPIKPKPALAYSYMEENGIHTELRATLDGKAIRIAVAKDHMTVNGKTYRFARAVTFPGEHPSDIYPPGADVFLASGTSSHRASLCLEGDSSGSGESNRHKQIYLLVDPAASGRKAVLLHLPSLLSSCRAVAEIRSGKLAFPSNRYLFDNAEESRIGLHVRYYTFENGRFVRTGDEIRLRFVEPEIPFRFSVQDEDSATPLNPAPSPTPPSKPPTPNHSAPANPPAATAIHPSPPSAHSECTTA